MARLKLKQVLSSLSYEEATSKLTLSGSQSPSFAVSGAIDVVSTNQITGSITIKGIDTFGDSGSFYTVDLGDY